MQPSEVQYLILRFLKECGFSYIDTRKLSNGHSLTAQGSILGTFLRRPLPSVVLDIKVLFDSVDFTIIQVSGRMLPPIHFWKQMWISLIILFISMLPCYALVMDIGLIFKILVFIPSWITAIIFIVIPALKFEKISHGLSKIESRMWGIFEKQDHRLLDISSGEDERTLTFIHNIIISSLSILIAIFFAINGLHNLSISLLTFIYIPLILVILIKYFCYRLPYRYQWLTNRMELSLLWFFSMFSPYILIVGASSEGTVIFPLPGDSDHSDPSIPFMLAVFLIIFFNAGLLETILKYREFHLPITVSPSAGYEEIDTSTFWLGAYRVIVIFFFAILSIGTLLGIFDLAQKLLDPDWRMCFGRYIGEGGVVSSVFGYAVLILLSLPLILTIPSWVYRTFRSIISTSRGVD